jgi:hypothetical protein
MPIYREDNRLLDEAWQFGCDIINLDSSHLYAPSRINNEGEVIRAVECGVISDVTGDSVDAEWDSTLSIMLTTEGDDGLNPLALTGHISSSSTSSNWLPCC